MCKWRLGKQNHKFQMPTYQILSYIKVLFHWENTEMVQKKNNKRSQQMYQECNGVKENEEAQQAGWLAGLRKQKDLGKVLHPRLREKDDLWDRIGRLRGWTLVGQHQWNVPQADL